MLRRLAPTAALLLPLLALGCAAPEATLSGPAPTAPSANGAPSRRPNVLLILCDDLGYGDLARFNAGSKIPTPRLDQLAAQGTRFSDAHSSSGICSPSRYALLTGRSHWRDFHEIVDSFGPSALPPGRLTMAEMLQQQGYTTACIGKWHLGWDWNAIRRPGAEPLRVRGKEAGYPASAFDWSRSIPDGPLAHGFARYFGDDVPNFPPYAWIEGDRVLTPPSVPFAPDPVPAEGSAEGRPGPMTAGWRLDLVMPRITKEAVTWIEAQQEQTAPFFLYFALTAPHAPIVPARQWTGASEAGPYGDFVAQTDAAVGSVLDALARCGMERDTLVIFTSDNGPEAYAYERARRFSHRSMGPLRGAKRDVYEGGHRVPMIVRWPDMVAAGADCSALVCHTDLMATLASITGFDLPDDSAEDSFDLLPLWLGKSEKVRDFAVHNTYPDVYALRQGDFVLIDSKSGEHNRMPDWFRQQEGYRPAQGSAQLFCLSDDPGQKRDLAAQRPDLVQSMRTRLAQLQAGKATAPRLATAQ